MEIKVTGRHMEITPAIRAYAEQKVGKLPRYFDRVQSIEVVAEKGKQDHRVEIIVHGDRTDPFICHLAGPDVYGCIDEAVTKLERQLTNHKEKQRNHKHPPRG